DRGTEDDAPGSAALIREPGTSLGELSGSGADAARSTSLARTADVEPGAPIDGSVAGVCEPALSAATTGGDAQASAALAPAPATPVGGEPCGADPARSTSAARTAGAGPGTLADGSPARDGDPARSPAPADRDAPASAAPVRS